MASGTHVIVGKARALDMKRELFAIVVKMSVKPGSTQQDFSEVFRDPLRGRFPSQRFSVLLHLMDGVAP